MNPDHPNWSSFKRCMNFPKKCVHFDGPGTKCHGDTRYTRKLLERYPDTDVTGSLEYFKLWDARCDCEVAERVCCRLGPNYKQLEKLQRIDAAVVAAGMEGALPSVVGGYVSCPVVAVPTSVGYGASFQGVAALLGMLNSCAANVTVVNIDAGFKAGYVAGLIARQKYTARSVGE